jgi:hypothetical protein
MRALDAGSRTRGTRVGQGDEAEHGRVLVRVGADDDAVQQIHPAQAAAGPGEGGVALEHALVGRPAHLTGEMDLLPDHCGGVGCSSERHRRSAASGSGNRRCGIVASSARR